MKKVLTLLFVLLMLVGCKEKDEETITSTTYKIVSPSGAPSLSLLDLVSEDNIELDIVDGSEVLQAEFIGGEADIIIAPINLGVKLSNETMKYELVSVITWGNLHLVSTNKNFNRGTVAAFGEAAVPGKILNFLSDELKSFNLEWYGSVNEVSASLLAGQYEAAILAEPYLSMTKSKSEIEIYEIVDIQELYKEKTGFDSYPQAAIFINREKYKDDRSGIEPILNTIENSIKTYNSDSENLANRIDSVNLEELSFANPELIKKAYSRMALNYVALNDCLDEVTTFLELFNLGIAIE